MIKANIVRVIRAHKRTLPAAAAPALAELFNDKLTPSVVLCRSSKAFKQGAKDFRAR
jgi:hypothetical protein